MSNNPTKNSYWTTLQEKLALVKGNNIRDYFTSDTSRAEKYSLSLEGVFYDFSKTNIDDDIFQTLISFAKSTNITAAIEKLFNGSIVNQTEEKAALHTSLRDGSTDLKQLECIASDIRNNKWLGVTGKPIKNIIHIGLGGSELGPRMLYEALKHDIKKDLNLYFVANMDGADIQEALRQCSPETTLFIVVSKSFTTQETLVNAQTGLNWLQENITHDDQESDIINHHFIGVSANKMQARNFGLKDDNIVLFDEAVNGRFSLWSSVSLSICIAFGMDVFKKFLNGAHVMDNHFRETEFEKSMPVIMALVDIWHRNFCDYKSKAVIPYAQEFRKFSSYLQQLEMESNGKKCDLDGNEITDYETAPIVFGEVGTNSQHSFFQMLHQGTDIIPCDFIGIIMPNHTLQNHHDLLLSNMLAQSQSLMQGRHNKDKHHNFKGNRPSSTILLDKLDPYHLGLLIALYEHKVFVQSIIWNINCFDQFGVELGKDMARTISSGELNELDGSTVNLHSVIKSKEKKE